MASRLIKIRLPFLFLFCLEMFKENCLRMSESHREGRSVKPLRRFEARDALKTADMSEKSKNGKFGGFFLTAFVWKFKATSTYFQEFTLRQKEQRS